MNRLIEALNSGSYNTAKSLLSKYQYDLNNTSGTYPSQVMKKESYNGTLDISLPTAIHQIVSTNNPILIKYITANCSANINGANSQECLYKVLLNRKFDAPVKLHSAILNLRILFENGAPIRQSIIPSLFVNYMFQSQNNNGETLKTIRINLLRIIREIYLLLTFEQFLRHIELNNTFQAIRYINSDISALHPGLTEYRITGKIVPNYDGGMRGSAVLIAAGLGDQSINMFKTLLGTKTIDLNFRDKQGMNVVYKLAMRGDLQTLKWVLSELSDHHRFQLLTLKVKDQRNQKTTPFQIANIAYNAQPNDIRWQQVISVLREAVNYYSDYILKTIIVKENPDVLTNIFDAGYDLEKIHSSNQNNILHFAATSNINANIRFIWRRLSNAKKLEFLLQNNQDYATPLKVAQQLLNDHMVRIINELATKLVEELQAEIPDAKNQLVYAGYDIVNVSMEERLEVDNPGQQDHTQETQVLATDDDNKRTRLDRCLKM